MNFNEVTDFIMLLEGGYGNDPNDPGKETNMGISKAAHPGVDIKNLTREQARNIYFNDYWTPIRGSDLSMSNCLIIFDCAVNQGVSTAIKLLQKQLKVTEDGVFGPNTLAAYNQRGFNIQEYAAQRVLRYTESPNFDQYGHGWMLRMMRVIWKSILG